MGSSEWPVVTEKTEGEDQSTPLMQQNGEAAPPVPSLEERGPFSATSVVDLFKKEQQELADAKTVLIPVKGYEMTGLQIQYKMPNSGKDIEMIANKVNRQHKDTYTRNLYTAMDVLINLCDGLYVQPEDVPAPVPLDPENVGEPCMFDTTLAELLGMDMRNDDTTARAVVLKLFGGNELALMTHAFDLNRWLQNTKADLNLEMWQVGE